jgi:hypothetical protein
MIGWRWCGSGCIALAVLTLDAAPTRACGWWWLCDGPYTDRPPSRAYSYRGRSSPYRYGRPGWAYGYTSPDRVYGGSAYAAWPSTSIPQTSSYLNTATPVPNAGAIGLTIPVTSAEGLREGGLPPGGPSLFGPDPPPSTWAYAGYYGAPAYGYGNGYGYGPARSYGGPPPDTPSWWVEPRRRR